MAPAVAAGRAASVSKETSIGTLTLRDILAQLARPGRDPREDLPAPVFKQGVLKLEDLAPGMELTGTVLNVVDFGCFVDIGMHDSGLVHVSRLADRFIRDPHEVVAVGDIVKVWVMEVDKERRRVSLTMVRPGSERPRRPARGEGGVPSRPSKQGRTRRQGNRAIVRRAAARAGGVDVPAASKGINKVSKVHASAGKPTQQLAHLFLQLLFLVLDERHHIAQNVQRSHAGITRSAHRLHGRHKQALDAEALLQRLQRQHQANRATVGIGHDISAGLVTRGSLLAPALPLNQRQMVGIHLRNHQRHVLEPCGRRWSSR